MRAIESRTRRRAARSAVALALLGLAAPSSAAAIDPGVNYDSGSPAGKEYAIPFVEGRAEGAGTANQRAGANVPFGVGITPPGGGHSGGRGGGATGGGEKGRNATGGRSTGAGSPSAKAGRHGESAAALRRRIADAQASPGTTMWTLGIALAVVLTGALAWVLTRRPQQRAA